MNPLLSTVLYIFCLSTFCQYHQTISCKRYNLLSDFDNIFKSRRIYDKINYRMIAKNQKPDKEYVKSSENHLVIVRSAKDTPDMGERLRRCRSRVKLMNRVRYRYMTFEKLARKNPNFSIIARMSTCLYSMNNPDLCKPNFFLMNYIEFEDLIPLSYLSDHLELFPIKNYLRSFRVRMRIYKEIGKTMTLLKSLKITHCRLSIDRLAIKIRNGFRDLSETNNLTEKLLKDPLSEFNFDQNLEIKILGAEFLVINEKCLNDIYSDNYFLYMTTYYENAQQEHPSFGTWEMVMLILQTEMKLMLRVISYYGQTDPQLVSRLKQIRVKDNLNYSQHTNAIKNPLAPHYIDFMEMLHNMKQKQKVFSQDLGIILENCFLKMYQINQIMKGNEASKELPNEDDPNADHEYLRFLGVIRSNLKLNIDMRQTIPEVYQSLIRINFETDTQIQQIDLGLKDWQKLI